VAGNLNLQVAFICVVCVVVHVGAVTLLITVQCVHCFALISSTGWSCLLNWQYFTSF